MKPSSGRNQVKPRIEVQPPARGEVFDWRTFEPGMLPRGPDAPLAAELVTYRDNLDQMLRDHDGEFVVIKGNRIVSYHPTRPAAVKAAFQLFGREPVLVQRVSETEPVRRVGWTHC